jgi:hypothetical protein
MRQIRKYFFEILAGVLGIAFVVMLLYIVIVMPEDLMTRGTVMFALFFDGIALYFVFRKLWRTKWRYRVLPFVQKGFEKLARWLKIVAKKLGIKEKAPQTVLGGKSKIFFDGKLESEQTKRTKKPKGWKAMQSDKERLGYLYKHVVSTNISQGLPVFASETPSEIKEKKVYRDIENQIFDLYVENRYKDDVNLDADALEDLKKDLKNAKK